MDNPRDTDHRARQDALAPALASQTGHTANIGFPPGLQTSTGSGLRHQVTSASSLFGQPSLVTGQSTIKLSLSSGSAPHPVASSGIRMSAPFPGPSHDASDSIQVIPNPDQSSNILLQLLQQQQMMQQQMAMMQSHLSSQPPTDHLGCQAVSIYSNHFMGLSPSART